MIFLYNLAMNIFIIGAGFTGVQLAKRLINEKNKVTLFDNNEDKVRHAQNQIDCTILNLDGNDLDNLEDAGLAKADALVCVTDSDEINMITCSVVDAVYPNILKIARVRNDSYHVTQTSAKKKHADTFVGNHRPLYGIDYMIQPDAEAADAIVRAVEHGGITDVVTFDDSDYELSRIVVEEGSAMDGIEVKALRTLSDKRFVLVYIETAEESILPTGDSQIHAGNVIGVLCTKDDSEEILSLCGTKLKKLKKIALVGAGKIGTIVAEKLLGMNEPPKGIKRFFKSKKKIASTLAIIDSDKDAAKEASARFPNASVFKGDITEESFIREEGLDKYDLVICTTHNHELNMIISAYMESLGVEKQIALVAQSGFSDIARNLGIEVAIPVRDVVIDSILSHLRGKSVTGIHTVSSGDMEIIECDLPASSRISGKSLKDIALPGEYLLLLIQKPGSSSYELPDGNTVLSAGCHLVLISHSGNSKILELFGGKN